MYLLLASIAPAIFIMFIVYKYDTIKEPLSMLVKAFFGGLLSIVITLIIVYPIADIKLASGAMQSFFDAYITAGIPEELSKWIIFYWLISKAKDFDQYYDGILYAIFISMGFALFENIMYVMEDGMGTAIVDLLFLFQGICYLLFLWDTTYLYLDLNREHQPDIMYF